MFSFTQSKCKNFITLLCLAISLSILTSCGLILSEEPDQSFFSPVTFSDIPDYTGAAYVELNENRPHFDTTNLSTECFEYYDELDILGRCGTAYACIGPELMPTEERGAIGHIKPSGWHTVKYSDLIEDNYLYNRCHLIAYQLTGENDNEKNLITGTRQFNMEGMLPFETAVATYIKETNNHVMYRVTPIFEKRNLLASGVQMEAYSIEDNGAGICFNVFVYNVQKGITIDYATGESARSYEENEDVSSETLEYAVNSKNGKIHIKGSCPATSDESQAMSAPVFFTSETDAVSFSEQIAPDTENRFCGNCW